MNALLAFELVVVIARGNSFAQEKEDDTSQFFDWKNNLA